MFITEIELRELWRDGCNPLPAFPPGTRFSPAAQDFIKDHQLQIRFADTPPALSEILAPSAASAPQSTITNYQLQAHLDALHALALLTAAEARRYQLPALARRLDALAADCLELLTAERQGRDPAPLMTLAPAGGARAFAPGPSDHAILHWLNLLRASTGQVAALAAGSAPGSRPKLAAGLAQLSAAAADLGRRVQPGELGWNTAMV